MCIVYKRQSQKIHVCTCIRSNEQGVLITCTWGRQGPSQDFASIHQHLKSTKGMLLQGPAMIKTYSLGNTIACISVICVSLLSA